jgi:hypothetical protein
MPHACNSAASLGAVSRVFLTGREGPRPPAAMAPAAIVEKWYSFFMWALAVGVVAQADSRMRSSVPMRWDGQEIAEPKEML